MYVYKIVPIRTEHVWTLSGGVPDEDRKPYCVWEESNTANTTRTNSGSTVHEQDSFVHIRKFPLMVLYSGTKEMPTSPGRAQRAGKSPTRGHDRQTNRLGFVMLCILYRRQQNSNQINSESPVETCDRCKRTLYFLPPRTCCSRHRFLLSASVHDDPLSGSRIPKVL